MQENVKNNVKAILGNIYLNLETHSELEKLEVIKNTFNILVKIGKSNSVNLKLSDVNVAKVFTEAVLSANDRTIEEIAKSITGAIIELEDSSKVLKVVTPNENNIIVSAEAKQSS